MCIPKFLKFEILVPADEIQRRRKKRPRRDSSPSTCEPARPLITPDYTEPSSAERRSLPPHIAPTFWTCTCGERPHIDFDVCPVCLHPRALDLPCASAPAETIILEHISSLIRRKQEEQARHNGISSFLFRAEVGDFQACTPPPPPHTTPNAPWRSTFDNSPSSQRNHEAPRGRSANRAPESGPASCRPCELSQLPEVEPIVVTVQPRKRRSHPRSPSPRPRRRRRRPESCKTNHEISVA